MITAEEAYKLTSDSNLQLEKEEWKYLCNTIHRAISVNMFSVSVVHLSYNNYHKLIGLGYKVTTTNDISEISWDFRPEPEKLM